MFSSNSNDLYFSQSALAIYKKCPLKFRYRYLDSLYWPQDWGGDTEQRDIIEQGNLFHQLAQRYYARGETLTEELLSGDLKHWFQELRKFHPYNKKDVFYPEYELRINKDKLKIMAKFDLLYLERDKGRLIIYDWKTNKKPFSEKEDFKNIMQTIVYLYVLQEGVLEYFPFDKKEIAELKIIYWNPRFPGNIRSIKYSKDKFLEDRFFLTDMIGEIRGLGYDEFTGIYNDKVCRYCEYHSICFGKKPELVEREEEDLELDLDWESIDEIQF